MTPNNTAIPVTWQMQTQPQMYPSGVLPTHTGAVPLYERNPIRFVIFTLDAVVLGIYILVTFIALAVEPCIAIGLDVVASLFTFGFLIKILQDRPYLLTGDLYKRCSPLLARAVTSLIMSVVSVVSFNDVLGNGSQGASHILGFIFSILGYFLFVNWTFLRPYKMVQPTVFYVEQPQPMSSPQPPAYIIQPSSAGAS